MWQPTELYSALMPMPKRASVDDYFAQLNDVARPHLESLRALSLEADPTAREELKWNLPVYVRAKNTNLWMLQNFTKHCSLRFSPPFFASQKAAVTAAGYECGEGFIKLPYARDLPLDLLKTLMHARVEDFEATGAE
jgi:uncharacterized protein YdhG (YjbR/CyaY superfamily)